MAQPAQLVRTLWKGGDVDPEPVYTPKFAPLPRTQVGVSPVYCISLDLLDRNSQPNLNNALGRLLLNVVVNVILVPDRGYSAIRELVKTS